MKRQSRRTDADDVAWFAENMCRHSVGEWAGQPVVFTDWQRKDLLEPLFSLRPDGRRCYRTALIGMPRKNGKLIAHDVLVPTPAGLVRHGSLKRGDCLFGVDGSVTSVLATSGEDEASWDVRFTTGESIIVHGAHEWPVWDPYREKTITIETEELADRVEFLAVRGQRLSVPISAAAEGCRLEAECDLYLLGLWLGDGDSGLAAVTVGEEDAPEMAALVEAAGGVLRPAPRLHHSLWAPGGIARSNGRSNAVLDMLRRWQLIGNKHIPEPVFGAATEQRLALLQGLMDTDGTVDGGHFPSPSFSTTNGRLADDFRRLAHSLGYKVRHSYSRPAMYRGKACGTVWTIHFVGPLPPFRLRRKLTKVRPLNRRSRQRAIKEVRRVAPRPGRCIQVDHPDGLYLVDQAHIPTHNSLLGSVLALFGLIADGEPGAECYSCAGSRQQARIVFGEAQKMVRSNPELSRVVKVYHDTLAFGDSIYRVLSAEAGLQHGLNPSMVIFDELHVQPNDDLWVAMTLGSAARRQPLVVAITTAGYDEESLCYRLYDYGRKVQAGEVDDPEFFFRWYEPLDAAGRPLPNVDHRSPAVWRMCNPGLVSGFLKEEDFVATVRTTPESEFRRFKLNQWTPSSESWLPPGAWDACEDRSLELDPASPLKVGIDLGLKHDSTAVVWAQRLGERTVVRARVWENPHPINTHEHVNWKLNIIEVETFLRELYNRFPAPSGVVEGEPRPGPAFLYDPHFFERSAQVLAGDGLTMVEFPQSDQRMIPACQTLYELVVEEKLAHDGNHALRRHIINAVAEQKDRGFRLTKRRATKKIDAAIACAIAVRQAHNQQPPEEPFSIGVF